MKKIKKIMLTLLVMSFLANPMCLILRVHAANEEIAMSRISDTLQSVMQSSEEETIEVMIWLEDINTSQAVLSSTESILSAAKATLYPRALCENPETDAEIYSRYMDARKEKMREHYEAYTKRFVDFGLTNNEVVYCSKYSPMVIAELSLDRIIEVSLASQVCRIEYNDGSIHKIESIDNGNQSRSWEYHTMSELKQNLGINALTTYTNNHGDGVKVGFIDVGYPNIDEEIFSDTNIFIRYEEDRLTDTEDGSHPTLVLEILYAIAPDADFYYTTSYRNGLLNTTLYSEIEWFILNNVDVVNCSMNITAANGINDGFNNYGAVSQYLDYVTSNYDFLFLKSAGNSGKNGITSGGMANNIITVGNYNQSTHLIDPGSSYYNNNLLVNKPDVCVRGVVDLQTTGEISATSCAAPIVSGIAALIYGAENGLVSALEVKAIICASTDAHRYAVNNTNYRKYGAGEVDAWNIREILQMNSYSSDYFSPAETSHTYTFVFDDIDERLVDLVLTFERNVREEDEVFDSADIDIELYDFEGNIVAQSTTPNNNVEILRDVPCSDEPYTLVIIQYELALYGDEESSTKYALSWCYKE